MMYDKPVVVRGKVSTWSPLSWSLVDWSDHLPPEIEVRVGETAPSFSHPQWERHTRVEKINTRTFFTSPFPNHKWGYYDYKYMEQVMPSSCDSFPWDQFSLPGRNGRESSLWVGTEHSHTPTHQDSYGYNLVAQIVGNKTWTLFPPEQGEFLSPTRVPYEESSVYSSVDLTHLDKVSEADKKSLSQTTPYRVRLEPGEVLYVPRRWWHHVYNNSFSISVNTWVQTPLDHQARVEEALVRYRVASLCKGLKKEERDILLNPNEDDLVEADLDQLADLVYLMIEEEEKQENGCHTKMPDFGDDYIELKPGTFDFEGSSCAKIARMENVPENSQLNLLNAFTSESVIKEAAVNMKKQWRRRR